MTITTTPTKRNDGNSLVLAIFLILVLLGLAMAQAMLVQKNLRSSDYFSRHSQAKMYAESGTYLALHELRYGVSGGDGMIGTTSWTALNDVGIDGVMGTADEGEGDGVPTLGEPNTTPITVGPPGAGLQLVAYTEDTAWPNVKHIVASASSGDARSSVETYVRQTVASVPKVGAVYVEPDTALDLKGNAFLIDGNDHNPDGTLSSDPAVYGITTAEDPDSPGDNAHTIVDQVDTDAYDQVTGEGGDPSVGETAVDVDIPTLFETLHSMNHTEYEAATHSGVTWGDSDNYQISYIKGDLKLSGNSSGAGALLVEGNLTFSGQMAFEGVIIVLGDVRQVGGGSGVHITGGLFVGSTISVVDNDPEFTVTGTSDILYSSAVIDRVNDMLGSAASPYTVLYWNILK